MSFWAADSAAIDSSVTQNITLMTVNIVKPRSSRGRRGARRREVRRPERRVARPHLLANRRPDDGDLAALDDQANDVALRREARVELDVVVGALDERRLVAEADARREPLADAVDR